LGHYGNNSTKLLEQIVTQHFFLVDKYTGLYRGVQAQGQPLAGECKLEVIPVKF